MNTYTRPQPSRRQFIQTAASATLALGLAQEGHGDSASPIILGSGSHRYECLHDWLKPPPDILWGDTHGVVEDSKGRLYVTHTVNGASKKKDAILVFDAKGKFLNSWGEQYVGGGHGLTIRKEKDGEYLYHCDVAHNTFSKTTLEGKVIWEHGTPKEAGVYKDGAGFKPTNIALSPDGDIFVGDGYGSSYIHRYTKDGDYKATFGGPGKDPGKFLTPHGLWVDNRGKEPLLVVADRGNRRLQYVTLEGRPISMFYDGIRQPCHFSIQHGMMLIPDLESVVTLLDENNRLIAHLGDGAPSNLRDAPRDKFIPGKFVHPHGATFLKNGDILVAEWVPIGRITRLKRVTS